MGTLARAADSLAKKLAKGPTKDELPSDFEAAVEELFSKDLAPKDRAAALRAALQLAKASETNDDD